MRRTEAELYAFPNGLALELYGLTVIRTGFRMAVFMDANRGFYGRITGFHGEKKRGGGFLFFLLTAWPVV